MFYALSKLLDVFLSPLMWSALLFAFAIPWRDRKHARSARRVRRRRRVCGAAGLLVLFVTSSPPFANWLLWRLEHARPSTFRPDVTYDAVVLLGGVVEEQASAASGQSSYNDNVERLIATHRLLRDGNARIGIVTGASSSPAFAAYGDSVVLTRQLEDWGIAKERLVGEDKALNTRENALFTRQIARTRGLGRVLVVTSAFHMPRAAECFAAVDMNVDTLAVDYRSEPPASPTFGKLLPRAHSLGVTAAVVREVFGRVVYRVQGYGRPVP